MFSALFLGSVLYCSQHPVYCALTQLLPHSDQEVRYSLSNEIPRAARAFDVDWRTLVAIVAQESSGRLVHVEYPDGHADLGPFQINSGTARAFGCDVVALRAFQLGPSADCAAKVLATKLRNCRVAKVPKAARAGCYHSYTPALRDAYAAKLRRWLRKLEAGDGKS